ncbi:protein cereblon-like isoform X1 [Athalia rosae]|uniref:protein cereblon-like isoform X1 n=1 Tax=Athalia rosae TaxID=37344 RepID=UPI002034964C|nr:protein cereblon-like isoform X1 [Athalia rosae]
MLNVTAVGLFAPNTERRGTRWHRYNNAAAAGCTILIVESAVSHEPRRTQLVDDGGHDCYSRVLLFYSLLAVYTKFNRHCIDRVPDFVLCRNCGGDVADSHDIINHLSPDALVRTNQTLFGRPETELQVLINSLGIEFQIFTTSFARCVGIGESWHQHYSWFPGYAWKLCFCSQCGSHVGWMFEPLRTATVDRNSPSNEGFYAIIRESVISETFANSLLVVPKLYRN